MANLEEVLVPMYMFHRFQVEAASKVLGGSDYNFALRGDGQVVYEPVPAAKQREAFNVLMGTLTPQFLAVPEHILKMIPPRAFRFDANPRETFKRHTGLAFDPLAPAEAAAGLTLRMILNPERCSRLVSQRVLKADLPTFSEITKEMNKKLWKKPEMVDNVSYYAQIDRMVAMQYLDHLMKLANNKETASEVRMNAYAAIDDIKTIFDKKEEMMQELKARFYNLSWCFLLEERDESERILSIFAQLPFYHRENLWMIKWK
jgi:hypothetical protein